MKKAIVAILVILAITVPLYFDITLCSCFDLSKVTVLYLLVFLAVGISLGKFWLPFLWLPVLLVVGCTALSTVMSVSPYMSLVGTYKRYGGLLSLVVYVMLFFLVVRFIDKRRVESVISVIIITGVIASVYGFFQEYYSFYEWSSDFGSAGVKRNSSTFGHPAFFGAFLVMTVPLVLHRIFSMCSKKVALGLYLPVLVVLLMALYETRTRASFIGLVVSVMLFGFLVRRQVNKWLLLGLLVICIGGVGFSVNKRFSSDFRGGLSGTSLDRVLQYKTALRIVKDYPVFGIGPDTLGLMYARYYKGSSFENQNRIHNEALDIMVSVGLVGLTAYMVLFLAWGRMILSSPAVNHTLLAGLVSGVMAYLVQNQFSFGHVPIITLFWMMIGLTVVVCRDDNKSGVNLSDDCVVGRKHISVQG